MDEPELIEFRPDERAEVLEHMRELAADGKGWINLEPGIDPAYEPAEQSGFLGLLTGRGPDATLATWTPGEQRRGRVGPVTIGLQHAAGPKAADRLRSLGTPVPPEWRVTGDHSRRGLVVLVPDGTDHDIVLRWLLDAGTALSPHLPLTGTWRASIYRM